MSVGLISHCFLVWFLALTFCRTLPMAAKKTKFTEVCLTPGAEQIVILSSSCRDRKASNIDIITAYKGLQLIRAPVLLAC